ARRDQPAIKWPSAPADLLGAPASAQPCRSPERGGGDGMSSAERIGQVGSAPGLSIRLRRGGRKENPAPGHESGVIDMRVSVLVLALIVVWLGAAFISGRLAARKNPVGGRGVRLGRVLRSLALVAHALYPSPPAP